MGTLYFSSGFLMAVSMIMQITRPTEAWFFILAPAIGCLIGGVTLENNKDQRR